MAIDSVGPLNSSSVSPLAIESFRKVVRDVCASGDAMRFLVLNFSRKALGQTGDGHFSPIGGYHASKDLILVMDVARFKYPPYWVPLTDLWDAMIELDASTQCGRGYFVVSTHDGPASPSVEPTLLP